LLSSGEIDWNENEEDDPSMPMASLKLTHWPYGLRIEVVDGGIMLRPARKARADWARRFRSANPDDLADLRELENSFDKNDWKW
jgi:hypothetical protein